jgi:hypothetical protein
MWFAWVSKVRERLVGGVILVGLFIYVLFRLRVALLYTASRAHEQTPRLVLCTREDREMRWKGTSGAARVQATIASRECCLRR